MTDLRKLAARIADDLHDMGDSISRDEDIRCIERILREHHEKEVLRVLDSLYPPDLVRVDRHYTEGFGEWRKETHEASYMRGVTRRVLEGGAAESSGVAADTEVPASDQPQVTNYDAEAEARAREGVWVSLNDRVRCPTKGFNLAVVGHIPEADEIVCRDIEAGFVTLFDSTELFTLDDQPVLGFREPWGGKHPAAIENTRLSERIAELERELEGYKKAYAGLADDYQRTLRERDEARTERDDMHKMLIQFKGPAGWVRLDDATIERVFHEINQGAGTLYDDVIRVLRSLRDGKFKEASDDDA